VDSIQHQLTRNEKMMSLKKGAVPSMHAIALMKINIIVMRFLAVSRPSQNKHLKLNKTKM
jgi:hypothetical protein